MASNFLFRSTIPETCSFRHFEPHTISSIKCKQTSKDHNFSGIYNFSHHSGEELQVAGNDYKACKYDGGWLPSLFCHSFLIPTLYSATYIYANSTNLSEYILDVIISKQFYAILTCTVVFLYLSMYIILYDIPLKDQSFLGLSVSLKYYPNYTSIGPWLSAEN